MNNLSLEPEHWFRYDLPKKLGLNDNDSKRLEQAFNELADFVRPLAEKAPDRLEELLSTIKDCLKI